MRNTFCLGDPFTENQMSRRLSQLLNTRVSRAALGLSAILTIGFSACSNPVDADRRENSPAVSLKLTDEDAIDRYSCRWYQENNMWILVCTPVSGGGSGGTYQLAAVTVTANTTASAGTFQLGQRPYDPNKRFDTDPNAPVPSFFGNGIPAGEDGFTLPNREPDYLERRYADSVFVASGLAARPNVVPMSPEEVLACSMKLVKCIVVFNIRNIAYDLAAQAAQQDPNSIKDGQRDAYRHLIGQILATGRLGPAEARFWGDLHEYSHWENSRSNYMDLWNNAVARGIALPFWSTTANIGERLAQNLARQADLCHQIFYVGSGQVPEATRPTLQQITAGSPGDGAYGCR
jgi:hypothetical protein